MLEMLGERQKALLKLLPRNKDGLTVDAMSAQLGITRNAVRQHLAALENDGLVKKGNSRATRGRPEQLYQLTDKGHECFPRHYAWFAQLLVESVARDSGPDALHERLDKMGTQVGQQLLSQQPASANPAERLRQLTGIMQQFGYEAALPEDGTADTIEADNCVFHALAQAQPHICAFDLALLSSFTGRPVEHQECMAQGGAICRFKFKPAP